MDRFDHARSTELSFALCVLLQLWVYRCIQELMFLQPRISRHPFYREAKGALLADKNKHFLVCFCSRPCHSLAYHGMSALPHDH